MKKSIIHPVIISLVVVVSLAVTATAEEFDPSLYAGLKSCRMCHRKDDIGNQFAVWEKGPHAKAYELLAKKESKEVAAKLGIDDPQKSGKCLKCHATAYNGTETVQTDAIDPDEGVVCESCHGPGKNYKKKSLMQEKAKACEAGLIENPKAVCVRCHNDASPTWKPDRYTKADGTKVGFDADLAYEKIKHPRPKK